MKTNVPESYQKTEFGIVPNDWKIRKLVECCNKITDGTHDTPKPVAQGIPFLTAIHVKEGFIDFNNCYYLPQSIHESIYKRCNPEKNDVLMVNIGAGVATTALIDVEYEFSLKNVALLKPDKNNLIGSYLNYCLSLNKFRITNQLLSGGAQPFLSLKQIGEISIPIPPTIEEQEAIAQSLSDVDALITECDRIITKKRNTKQSTMQQLLTGKKRLPGFSGEWEVRKLGEIGEFKNGINKGKEDFGFGYPFVNLLDVFGRSKIFQGVSFGLVNSSGAERKIYELRKGDILFIRSSVKPEGVGLTSVVNDDLEDTVYSGFLIRFRDFGELDFEYKVHCFNEEEFRKRVIDSSTVSANTNINQDALKNLQITLPPTIEEQKAIAQILSDMDTEIAALEQKRDKYKAIKQGMMQELLTGKTRLIGSY